MRKYFGAILVIAVNSACSPLPPSSSIVGDWQGRVAPLHLDYLMIRFRQSGRDIEGTACYFYFNAPVGSQVGFKDVPVRVDYPRVFLQAPSGFTFTGRFQADGTLTGTHATGSSPYPMSLARGGNYCGL